MSERNDIEFSLSLNTENTFSEVRKLEITLYRVMGYVEMMTGDPNLKKAIKTMQDAIRTARALQMAYRAMQLASGPIGWAYAGTTIVAAALVSHDLMMDCGGT